MCTPKPVAPNLCRRKHPGTHPTMRGRSGLHWGCLGKGGELDWFRWTGQLQGEACKAQCSAAEGICFLLYSEGGTSVTDSGLGTISLGDNRPGRAHGRRRRRRDAGDGAGGARCGGVGGQEPRGGGTAGAPCAPGRAGPRAGAHALLCSGHVEHVVPACQAAPGRRAWPPPYLLGKSQGARRGRKTARGPGPGQRGAERPEPCPPT